MTNVYNAPEARAGLDSSQSQAVTRYMGFWARVLACLLDSIWVCLLLGVLFSVLGVEVDQFSPDQISSLNSLNSLSDLSSQIPSFSDLSLQYLLGAALVILLWIRFGSTPGKMLFGGRIVDARTLQPVSSLRLTLRYLAYFASLLPLGLGLLWVAWDPRKQGFHDKIAGTVVIIDRH